LINGEKNYKNILIKYSIPKKYSEATPYATSSNNPKNKHKEISNSKPSAKKKLIKIDYLIVFDKVNTQ